MKKQLAVGQLRLATGYDEHGRVMNTWGGSYQFLIVSKHRMLDAKTRDPKIMFLAIRTTEHDNKTGAGVWFNSDGVGKIDGYKFVLGRKARSKRSWWCARHIFHSDEGW